jgi:hypothetical protein
MYGGRRVKVVIAQCARGVVAVQLREAKRRHRLRQIATNCAQVRRHVLQSTVVMPVLDDNKGDGCAERNVGTFL